MGLRIQALIVHCLDPGRLAEFWAEALGWRITGRDDPEWVVEPPDGQPGGLRRRRPAVHPGARTQAGPEPPPPRPRDPEDQAAEVARLEALGATRVDLGQGDVPWTIMADPEGNEFCVLPAYSPEVRAQWQAQYDAYQPT